VLHTAGNAYRHLSDFFSSLFPGFFQIQRLMFAVVDHSSLLTEEEFLDLESLSVVQGTEPDIPCI
jgi:hypothetical protein